MTNDERNGPTDRASADQGPATGHQICIVARYDAKETDGLA